LGRAQIADICGTFGAEFSTHQAAIKKRVKTPLSAGYIPGGKVQALFARLDSKSQTIPTKTEIESLAGSSLDEIGLPPSGSASLHLQAAMATEVRMH
jgi:hypothetical protein